MAQPIKQQYGGPSVVTTPQASGQVLPKEAHQSYALLKLGYTALPIIVGTDKFFHVLTNWDQYMAPVFPRLLGIPAHSMMLAAGVVEIIAGIGVALKPRIFSYVVALWLASIVLNLILTGNYFDIALRDTGLAMGALALGRLSQYFDRRMPSVD